MQILLFDIARRIDVVRVGIGGSIVHHAVGTGGALVVEGRIEVKIVPICIRELEVEQHLLAVGGVLVRRAVAACGDTRAVRRRVDLVDGDIEETVV